MGHGGIVTSLGAPSVDIALISVSMSDGPPHDSVATPNQLDTAPPSP
jgi:hypothetical protein